MWSPLFLSYSGICKVGQLVPPPPKIPTLIPNSRNVRKSVETQMSAEVTKKSLTFFREGSNFGKQQIMFTNDYLN